MYQKQKIAVEFTTNLKACKRMDRWNQPHLQTGSSLAGVGESWTKDQAHQQQTAQPGYFYPPHAAQHQPSSIPCTCTSQSPDTDGQRGIYLTVSFDYNNRAGSQKPTTLIWTYSKKKTRRSLQVAQSISIH